MGINNLVTKVATSIYYLLDWQHLLHSILVVGGACLAIVSAIALILGIIALIIAYPAIGIPVLFIFLFGIMVAAHYHESPRYY